MQRNIKCFSGKFLQGKRANSKSIVTFIDIFGLLFFFRTGDHVEDLFKLVAGQIYDNVKEGKFTNVS